MKPFAVLRHAKSNWDDASLGDLNRPLNDRGWKAARRIGREMKHRRMHFDLVLASNAARVRETIDGIEQEYDFGAEIRFDPRLYLADPGDLLSILRELSDSVSAPLLVGHNPGLQRLIICLTCDDARGLRARIADKYPTGAFAALELDVERWADAAAGCATLSELILPKDLD